MLGLKRIAGVQESSTPNTQPAEAQAGAGSRHVAPQRRRRRARSRRPKRRTSPGRRLRTCWSFGSWLSAVGFLARSVLRPSSRLHPRPQPQHFAQPQHTLQPPTTTTRAAVMVMHGCMYGWRHAHAPYSPMAPLRHIVWYDCVSVLTPAACN
jgi:hypothetical protein